MSRRLVALPALLALVTLPLAAQPVPLAVGRPVRGILSRADTTSYRLDADSGALVRLTVDQVSGNALLRVSNARGAVVRSVNASPRGMERAQIEFTEQGPFTVKVVPADSSTGEYVLTLTARERLSSDPATLVGQLLAPWDRRDGPGAAVAVWRGGKTLYAKAFGMANLAYDIPFTTDTRTNIGSTSKQFTAFAVMLLVDEGRLSLDDDIRKHFPELPDLGTVVTVRHLLTHTTGFREVYNAALLAGRRIDEGDYVSREEMISLVQHQPALQNAPGAEFNYNNTSFALLSMLVERVAHQPFPAFMQQRVFGPLGMTHTVVNADRMSVIRNASTGYSRDESGEWRALGDLASSMGAGGIYTTLGDLQTWVENYHDPKVGTAAGIRQMMTPFTLTSGKSTGYGFGLFIDRQGPLTRVHHGGADVSHRSQLAYYPEINAGVTVQSNDGAFDSGIAFRIAKAFFPEITPRTATVAAFDAASWDVRKFDAFAGRYALDLAPSMVLTFSRSADTLSLQLTGQGKLPIVPTSDSSFAVRNVAATVDFQRDATGKVTGVILHQGGDNHATRLEGPAPEAAKPWMPSAAELQAFAGRYFSEELEAYYDVSVNGPMLQVTNRRLPPAKFARGVKDTFNGTGAAGTTTLVFERDRNGQVTALYAGNGRTRDVRFVKVR